jgi:hypothetical protein
LIAHITVSMQPVVPSAGPRGHLHQLDRDSTADILTGPADRNRLDEVLATGWHRAASIHRR